MNRYPKRGKGFRWTVKELEAIPLSWKGDTLADGDGLQGEVRLHGANVSVTWRYAYKWEGKTKRHYCGTWPSVALDQVRGNRDQAREWVKIGVNPSDQKRVIRIEAQRQIEATLPALPHIGHPPRSALEDGDTAPAPPIPAYPRRR